MKLRLRQVILPGQWLPQTVSISRRYHALWDYEHSLIQQDGAISGPLQMLAIVTLTAAAIQWESLTHTNATVLNKDLA